MSMILNLQHIVFNTYRRKMTISPEHERELYKYLWRLIENRNSKLIRIGGIANHVHLLVDLHSTVAPADIGGELKRKSSLWMKRSGLFPYFEGWGKEFFSFSKSGVHKSVVANYIRAQKEHHRVRTFEEELYDLVVSEGFEWDEKLLT